MKKSMNIFKYAGVVCIPFYIFLTFISHLFNTKINPLDNWLSDYGNSILNPSGAIYYNAGCITVAALLFVFYIGIHSWYKGFRIQRKYIICYIVAQIGGITGCIALTIAAIFNLGTSPEIHSMVSRFNMIGIDFFLTFTATAFMLNPKANKIFGILGFLIAFFNIITTNFFTNLYIAEWIYFGSFMIYMLIITLHYDFLLSMQDKQNNA